MNTYVFVLFAVGVVLLTFARRRHVSGKGFALFRALFPSWRFFDEAGQFSKLYYRVGSGPWLEVPQGSPRSWSMVLLNPSGNLMSAGHSLVDQLVSEINDTPEARLSEIPKGVSYQLVQRWVRHQIAPSVKSFQFKIVLGGEDVLVSPELTERSG